MDIYRHTLDFGLHEERNAQAAADVVNDQQALETAFPNQQAVEEVEDNQQLRLIMMIN